MSISSTFPSEHKVIRPGCFDAGGAVLETLPANRICLAAGRCHLTDACMWTKNEIDLREDPNRGADTANMNNVLGSR